MATEYPMLANVSSKKTIKKKILDTPEFRRKQGERLRKFREYSGLSQMEFAEKVGIPRYKPVSNMERGVTAINPKLAKLIQYELGCSHEWLLEGVGPMLAAETESPLDQARKAGSGRTWPKITKVASLGDEEPGGSSQAGYGQGLAMLERIYGSGDQTMVQAINVSLSALNEALGYKELAKQVLDTQQSIREDIRRLQADFSKLKAENELLRRQLDCKHKNVAGG